MIVEIEDHVGVAIERTLQYFALFRYPLLVSEIRQYCAVACTEPQILAYLQEQELHANVFSLHGYYSLLPDVAALIQRRLHGNRKAVRDLALAKRVGRFIYQFPFVSYVGISGSLSKGYSDAHSDFDFFIITEKDRLWICRTLLHLMKKLSFIVGQQHKLCMNYFIDETALPLQEKNIYTATELNSLIPVCGSEMHERLLYANVWVTKFLPNYKREEHSAITDRAGMIKRIGSGIFNMLPADAFNHFLMKLTDAKWRKKWSRRGFPQEDYDLAFKTRINISKNHRLNYQKRVLSALSLQEE